MARSNTRLMIKNDLAATCDYVEDYRRSYAEKFVISAFNGYVDSILARVKHDNAGKLSQEVKDAYAIVNEHGQAFRNAAVTPEYLRPASKNFAGHLRQLLRKQQQEEQRRIREQIREEEKARRDYERAIKEARREEEMLQSAVAEAMAKLQAATAEQREAFEQQLRDLEAQLAARKNDRAISMAQQTGGATSTSSQMWAHSVRVCTRSA